MEVLFRILNNSIFFLIYIIITKLLFHKYNFYLLFIKGIKIIHYSEFLSFLMQYENITEMTKLLTLFFIDTIRSIVFI